MRLPKRGEKGFTLIELLIVVAILGVLAAVVIPNVTRFFGKGEEEAGRTELHNVALAVTSMMVDNGITTLPSPVDATPTGDMSAFPDALSGPTTDLDTDLIMDKRIDPEGFYYGASDGLGYVLYGHDVTGSETVPGPANPEQGDVNYVNMSTTSYTYTCDADGTVHQYDAAGVEIVY